METTMAHMEASKNFQVLAAKSGVFLPLTQGPGGLGRLVVWDSNRDAPKNPNP